MHDTFNRRVLTLTSAAAFMVALDQLVVATALTTMQRDLHASLATLEWIVNALQPELRGAAHDRRRAR